jgi:hypothetical protein
LWSPDGTQPPEPGTDPMMPAITDDVLPPWDTSNTPARHNRSLAAAPLTDLDGDPSGLGEDAATPRPTPTQATDAERVHRPVGAARIDRWPDDPATGARGGVAGPDRWPGPAGGRPDRPVGAGRADREAAASTRPRTVAELVAQTYGLGTASGAKRLRPSVAPRAGEQWPRPPGRAGAGEVRSTRWSGDAFGAPPYGSSLPPPFPTPERPSLTGLTRRSMSRAGSITLRLAFMAVFLLIVIQLLVTLFTR